MTKCERCAQVTPYHAAGCPMAGQRPFVADNRHAAKRLPVDEQGRTLCRCGLRPVAYRNKCKPCSAADVRARRARHAAAPRPLRPETGA